MISQVLKTACRRRASVVVHPRSTLCTHSFPAQRGIAPDIMSAFTCTFPTYYYWLVYNLCDGLTAGFSAPSGFVLTAMPQHGLTSPPLLS